MTSDDHNANSYQKAKELQIVLVKSGEGVTAPHLLLQHTLIASLAIHSSALFKKNLELHINPVMLCSFGSTILFLFMFYLPFHIFSYLSLTF